MTITVVKDDRYRVIDESQLGQFEARGYKHCPPPPVEQVEQEDARRAEVVELIMIQKGKRVRKVIRDQLEAFLNDGYKIVEGEANDKQERDESRDAVPRKEDVASREGRGEGSGPEGEGSGPSKEAGSDDEQASGRQDLKVSNEEIVEALKGLDHKNDANWTVHGTPRVAVVQKALGGREVTGEMIQDALPGFKRDED